MRRQRLADRVDRRAVAPLGEVGRRPRAAASARTLRSTPMTARKSSYRSLASLERDLARCRACAEAGLPARVAARARAGSAASAPISSARRPASSKERSGCRGAGAPAGRSAAGSSSTRTTSTRPSTAPRSRAAIPGRAASGRGDRTPTPREQELCSFWRDWELELLRPRLIVTVGGLALRRLLGLPSLTPCVGERYELDGTPVVPLPHPSGASGWLNDPQNRDAARPRDRSRPRGARDALEDRTPSLHSKE